MKIIKKIEFKALFISFVLAFFTLSVSAQKIVEPMKPKRLVNDFAGVLTSKEVGYLEKQLRTFNDSTSTQIVLVTVKSLGGMDISQYATELGHKWGVGQKGKDNGIVILFKPKTFESRGQVFIAVGYGLEGAVPDATAKMIVQKEMLPYFKQNNIGAGMSSAVTTLMELVKGEYTADQYAGGKKKKKGMAMYTIILIILVVITLIPRKRSSQTIDHNGQRTDNDILPWILLGMMSSSRGNHGSSGGSFSGGGFGGFGGGGFGGGGAGGSW